MVDIIHFPKKCPHCKDIMFTVSKMYNSWLECRNKDCVYLTTVDAKEVVSGEPYPFSCLL